MKDKEKRKSKKGLIIGCIVVVLLIVASIGMFGFGNKSDQAPLYKGLEVKQEDIAQIIYVNGDVVSKESRNVAPEASGKVKTIKVKEGDQVMAGDVLAELDKEVHEYNLAELEIQLDIAKRSLSQIYANKKDAKTLNASSYLTSKMLFEASEKTYENAKTLFESGAYSQTQLDSAKMDYDQKKMTYDSDQNSYYGEKDNSDEVMQQMRIESTELKIEKLKKDIENTIITSPITGTITEVNIKEMDLVAATGAAFVVQDTNNLQVITRINQYDIGRMAIGKTVKVKSDGVPNQEFVGKMSSISSIAKKMQTGQSIETVVDVKIDLIGEEGLFRPNYSAKVEIAVSEAKDAITIPYESVYTDREGKKYVYKVVEGITEKIEITLGVEGDLTVQAVESDLIAGDILIANPTDEMTSGMTVMISGVDGNDNDK